MAVDARALIQSYFDAFNARDWDALAELATDDVVHEANQGVRRSGKAKFRQHIAHMARCYREQAQELTVFVSGDRAAAEFILEGSYEADDQGLPPAEGQNYRIRAGAFFEVRNGRLSRITHYYNLREWVDQITALDIAGKVTDGSDPGGAVV